MSNSRRRSAGGAGTEGDPKVVSASKARRRRLTQAERTALSDERMFNSAISLISKRGANRTTLKEICETAGYSRGLATYRFGSKEAFLNAVVDRFYQSYRHHLQEYVGDREGLDALFSAIEALETFYSKHKKHLHASYVIWYESIGGDNEVKTKLRELHDIHRSDVRNWVAQGISDGTVSRHVDPDHFAVLYYSVVFGTIYQWMANPDAIDIRAAFGYFRSLARRELLKQHGGDRTCESLSGDYTHRKASV